VGGAGWQCHVYKVVGVMLSDMCSPVTPEAAGWFLSFTCPAQFLSWPHSFCFTCPVLNKSPPPPLLLGWDGADGVEGLFVERSGVARRDPPDLLHGISTTTHLPSTPPPTPQKTNTFLSIPQICLPLTS
jgi:hypothetical protein